MSFTLYHGVIMAGTLTGSAPIHRFDGAACGFSFNSIPSAGHSSRANHSRGVPDL